MAQIYAGSAVNTTFDLVVFVLPIPRLLQVQISNKKKAGVCMTFLVGLFVTICSVVRLSYIVRWRATTNPTWTYNPIALWSIVESNVGVVCACMPALAGPIKRFWMWSAGNKLSSMYGSRKNKSSTPGSRHATSDNRPWTGPSGTHNSREAKNSIMCNTYMNVSDEMELVNKDSEQGGSVQGGTAAHKYRQRW